MPDDREQIELLVQQGLEAIQERGETLEGFLSRYPELANELRPSLEAALWLQQNQAALDASDTFIQASKVRLMAQIAAESGAAAQNHASSSSWRAFWESLRGWRFAYQLALALFVIVSLILTSTGVALAARDTIPGDVFYPVKRFEENLHLAFSFSPENDLRLLMEFAERRVLEMQELVLRDRLAYLEATQESHRDLLARSLELLRRIVQENPAIAQQLAREFADSLAGQQAVLNDLFGTVPEFAQGPIETALADVNSALGASQEIGDGTQVDATPTPTLTPTASATTTQGISPTVTSSELATATATASSSSTVEVVEQVDGTPTVVPTGSIAASPTPTKTGGGSNPEPDPTEQPPNPPLPSESPEPPTPRPTKTPGPTDPPTPTKGPNPTHTPKPPTPTKGPQPTDPVVPTSTPRSTQPIQEPRPTPYPNPYP